MAYDPLTTAETDGNSPVTTTLWTKVKNNFDFLKALFHGTTGHKHTGATDDGPLIASVADLAITPQKLNLNINANHLLKVAEANTAASTTSSTPVKKKEFTNNIPGYVVVNFSLERTGPYNLVYGQVYKNGVAHGTLRSTTNNAGPVAFSESLLFNGVSDLIQIYIHSTGSTTCLLTTCNIYRGFQCSTDLDSA